MSTGAKEKGKEGVQEKGKEGVQIGGLPLEISANENRLV